MIFDIKMKTYEWEIHTYKNTFDLSVNSNKFGFRLSKVDTILPKDKSSLFIYS